MSSDFTLTAYECIYAREQGATDDDIQSMAEVREYESRPHSQEEADAMEREAERRAEEHDDACDCSRCASSLFDGECDEDNDGGAAKRAAWKTRVAQVRVGKALHKMRESEQWISSWLRRVREWCAKIAADKAALEATKRAYVHVPGTSTWLKYGLVPPETRKELLLVTGVKQVDTLCAGPGLPIACRLHVAWPLPHLNDARREGHFRLLLQASGFASTTADDVMLTTWEGAAHTLP